MEQELSSWRERADEVAAEKKQLQEQNKALQAQLKEAIRFGGHTDDCPMSHCHSEEQPECYCGWEAFLAKMEGK